MFEVWIERYGYVAIVLGTFFEGESVLLIGGALAHRGLLSFPLVLACAFAGAVLGDQTWFRVGRKFGAAYIAKSPKLQKHHVRAEALLRRFGDWFVIGFRFVVGIRTVTPLLIGTTSFSATRFLALNVFGCAVWAGVIATAGFVLGASVKSVFERAGRIQEYVLIAIVVIALLAYATRRWRKRI